MIVKCVIDGSRTKLDEIKNFEIFHMSGDISKPDERLRLLNTIKKHNDVYLSDKFISKIKKDDEEGSEDKLFIDFFIINFVPIIGNTYSILMRGSVYILSDTGKTIDSYHSYK